MAEEAVSQAAASAPAAVSSPLSSPAPAPSASTAAPAAPAASTETPASQGTITQKTSETPARPEGIPDSYWDSAANSLKVDPAILAKDLKERDELKTFKAADDVRKGTLPQRPEDYKLELPADFKPPEGIEYKLDTNNPSLGQFKQIAHKHGLTQDAVNEILGIYAGNEVGTQQAIATARAAEVGKLGANAVAQIDNSVTWLKGVGLPSWVGMMVTAQQITELQSYITKTTTQGAAGFSQSHRAAPETNGIPGFEKMSFEQRRQAQDANAARRRTA